MTTEGTAAKADVADPDDDRLFCYRHPERETWIRCGRCDRPICTRCAMQGPVGFRCRQCGTLANDPLSTIKPPQAALALAVSVGLAAIVGLIGSRIGLFGIIISFIAGGFIAEAVVRLIGFKRGTTIVALVIGGIVIGTLLGSALGVLMLLGEFATMPLPEGVEFSFGSLIMSELPWIALSVGAACVGAYSRLR